MKNKSNSLMCSGVAREAAKTDGPDMVNCSKCAALIPDGESFDLNNKRFCEECIENPETE